MEDKKTIYTEVLVIGSGPGGYVAAIRAAQLGKQVIVIEQDQVGGICLNSGCIPSKALISAAHAYSDLEQIEEMGIKVGSVYVNFEHTQEWKTTIINKLTDGIRKLFKSNKIQLITGTAKFHSKNIMMVVNNGQQTIITFEHCIVATGSRPIEIPSIPFGGRVLSSTEALNLKHIPKSMVVIGGGYIGIELSQVFSKFGCKITILEGSGSILPGFEPRILSLIKRNLKKASVDVHTNAMAKSIEQGQNQVAITFETNGTALLIEAEYVLVTVGRRSNTDLLGLDTIGVTMDSKGYIEVNQQCQTSIPSVFAIGDVVKGPQLAHKASYEGKVAAEVIAGKNSMVQYKAIPLVVFSDPEVASVGLTEKEAQLQGYTIQVGRFSYGANGRALALHASEGSVTIVTEQKSGKILGAQIVGIEASNLIAEIALAIETDATVETLAQTIHAHPTLSEMVMEAAEVALGKGIHIH